MGRPISLANRAVLASAPGRVGITGNPSDMYGGCVVSTTTVERAFCEVTPAPSLVIRSGASAASVLDPGDLGPCGDDLDLVRAVLRWYALRDPLPCLSLRLWSGVPMQAGLGGSSALVIAALAALDRWFEVDRTPGSLAEAAHIVEYHEMGVLCGYQDHVMAVYGGMQAMGFSGKEDLADKHSGVLPTVRDLAPNSPGLPLVVAHSELRHSSGNVHATPYSHWQSGETAYVLGYRRIAEMATQAIAAIAAGDWHQVGALMNANHGVVRDLGGSHEANERLIGAALRAGALGAKLAGAGGGGTIVALAPDMHAVADALRQAGASRLLYPRPSVGVRVIDS